MNEQYNNRLFYQVIRVSKEDSAFVYFQLESNEGLAFFSTLSSSLGQPYRDIEVFTPMSLKSEIDHFVKYMESKITLQIKESRITDDRADLLIKSEKVSI